MIHEPVTIWVVLRVGGRTRSPLRADITVSQLPLRLVQTCTSFTVPSELVTTGTTPCRCLDRLPVSAAACGDGLYLPSRCELI